MSTKKTIIRQGRIQDMEAFIGLLRELFSIEADFEFNPEKQRRGLEQILTDLSGERCMMAAERDNRIIGMCSVQLLISTAEGGPAAMLEDMVVLRDCRGKGTGRQLLDAVGRWCEKKGVTRLQLLADRNNLPALGFYKGNGWQTTQLICLRKSR